MLEKLIFLGHHPIAPAQAPVTGQAVSGAGAGLGVSPLTMIIVLVLIVLGVAYWIRKKKK